jgi:hypothetical protein
VVLAGGAVQACAPARHVVVGTKAKGSARGTVVDNQLRAVVGEEDGGAEIDCDRLAGMVQTQQHIPTVQSARHGVGMVLAVNAREDDTATRDFTRSALEVRRRDYIRQRCPAAVDELPALLARQAHRQIGRQY